MAFEECEYVWRTSFSEELLSPSFPDGKTAFKWQLKIKSGQMDLISIKAPVGTIKVLCKFFVGNDTRVISHQFTSFLFGSPFKILDDETDFQSLKNSENLSFKLNIWALLLPISMGSFNFNLNDAFSVNLLTSISNDLDFCDLIIKVGSTEYNVHKSILASVSPVFRAALLNDSKEKNSNCIVISDFENEIVKNMIEFIYGRPVFIFDYKIGAELLRISDMYDIKQLKDYCIKQFTSSLMKEENVLQVILLADKYNASELKDRAIDYFSQSKKVYSPSEFEEITKCRPSIFPELVAKLSEKNALKNFSDKSFKFSFSLPKQDLPKCNTVATPDFKTLIQFLKDSNTYDIVHLKSFCTEHLKKMITDHNVLQIIVLADINNAPILKDYAINYFISSKKNYSEAEFSEIEKRPSLYPKLLARMSSKCASTSRSTGFVFSNFKP